MASCITRVNFQYALLPTVCSATTGKFLLRRKDVRNKTGDNEVNGVDTLPT